jgi:hypothetical protein
MKKNTKIIITIIFMLIFIPFVLMVMFVVYLYWIVPAVQVRGCQDVDKISFVNREEKSVVSNFGINKTNGNVYAISVSGPFGRDKCVKIDGIDKTTFEVVNKSYAKDEKNIYYRNTIVSNIGIDKLTFKSVGESYFKDKNYVYYTKSDTIDFTKIQESDVDTFELLGEGYAKDKNYIYYKSKPINIVDVETFVILNDDYVKDKNHVYCNRYIKGTGTKNIVSILDGVEPETFELVGENYTKDKDNVYYDDYQDCINIKTVEQADPETFIPVDNEY